MPTLEELRLAYCQIPSLDSYKRFMFVGPHPDDIEYGCGAFISSLKGKDKDICYVIVTDGAAGTADPAITPEMMKMNREQESLKAAAFMGVTHVEFLDLEDGGDYDTKDVLNRLIPLVLKYRPDIIFAPDPKLKTEVHPDHLKTGEAVRLLPQLVNHPIALKRRGIDISGVSVFPNNITLAFYFTDDHNHVAPVTMPNLDEKIQALMLHSSQMQDESTELLMTYFRLKALEAGKESETGLGEDFQVLIPIVQHVFAEGIHYNK